jgi:anti-sigma B factor antagonist
MKTLERQEGRMSNEEIIPGFDREEEKALKIRLQRIDDRCIVFYLDGYIDHYTCAAAEKKLAMAVENGFARIIVDARGLNYLSSTGVGIFVSLVKSLKPRNGSVVFMHFQPTVWEVLQILGFSKWMNVAENLDEAVRVFEGAVKEWPMIFRCPICDKKLKGARPGRFRCGECKTVLVLTEEMQVLLG